MFSTYRMAASPSRMTRSSPSTEWCRRASRTSPASAWLSSISSMNEGFFAVSLASGAWDCKVKRRTSSWFRFDPDTSAAAFHDSLANGEAHAGSRKIGGAVKTFEDTKDLLLILGLDADAVVADRKAPVVAHSFCRNVN